MNIGDRLLNYEILALLGKGGFGNVYLARDVNLDINVAIKVMRSEISHSATMLHRLRVGARASARLKHPSIQNVFYLGRDPETHVDFVVMEYLPGGTLRQRIYLNPLPLNEALQIFTAICNAIDFAHRHGVIHRDLKPDNVMFDEEGRLVVTDFDLARITGDTRHTGVGQTMGTLSYISPEQARGDEITHATDLYSLGVILFELITGQRPFTGETPSEILLGHLHKAAPQPSLIKTDLPDYLDTVIERVLAKAPGERYETAWQLGCVANNQPYTPLGKPFANPVAETDPKMQVPQANTIFVIPQAWLRIERGQAAGQRFEIGKGVSIGYGKKQNNIHLADDFVSRAHARIDQTETGYVLMDLKSTNGTAVNGNRIEPYAATDLNPGDLVELGDTRLIFETS